MGISEYEQNSLYVFQIVLCHKVIAFSVKCRIFFVDYCFLVLIFPPLLIFWIILILSVQNFYVFHLEFWSQAGDLKPRFTWVLLSLRCIFYFSLFKEIFLRKQTVLGAFAKLRKATLLCHVSLSAWNNSASTGRILMKLDIWDSFENLLRKFKFN
jgi:hypothetical protein